MGFSILPKIKKDKTGKQTISPYESQTLTNEVIFNSIFENHPDPVFTLTLEGEIALYNNSFLSAFGFRKNNITENFKKVFFHEEINRRFQLALEGESQSFKEMVRFSKGNEIIMHVTLVPLMDLELNVIGIYGSVKDLTKFNEYPENLESIKTKYELAQQVGKIGAWEYDILKEEVYWSKQLFEITGRDKNESARTKVEDGLDFVYAHDIERYRKLFTKAEKEGDSYSTEYRILKADRSIVYVHEEVEVIKDASENPIKIIGNTQDITKRKLAERALLETEQRFKHIYDNLSLGIRSYDAIQDKILYVTPGIELIVGYSSDIFYQKGALEKLIHPDDQPFYSEQYNNVLKGYSKGFEIQYRMLNKDSQIVWIQDKTIPVFNDQGKVIRIDGILTNITNRKLFEEKINQLAYYDILTQLPNSVSFNRKIESLVEQDKQFTVMFLDLDRFRNINNSLGHDTGDIILKQFCERVNHLLTGSYFFARLGGDEFGLVIWDYEQSNYPESIAHKIINHLNLPFIANDFELYLSTSIGISEYPANGNTTTEILKNTSSAVLRAKLNGKNNYHIYSSKLNISSFKTFELERDLRKSIDNNELVVHFQPRVQANSGKLLSAEALIRWRHPVWGLVSPGEFIPIAEESGFINDISDWVLKEVCRLISEWRKENLQVVPISINIPSQRFLKSDWRTFILYVLEEFNVNPNLLEFEITETTLFEHEKEIEFAIQFFKEMGIKIALDDFGTGYSSLAHIRQFSIDTIKIDKSFIQQIGNDQKVEIIIKSILFMAKGMEMNIVAEGVETLQQFEFLKQQECKEIQGYLFSEAVTEVKFTSFLKVGSLKPVLNREKAHLKDRRAFYRIDLLFPLSSQMTLTSFQGKEVNLGKTEVIIDNIGPGGLRIISTMELPVRPDVNYQFETTIMNYSLTLNGFIVWKNEVKDRFFEYGIEFSISEKDRDQLLKILNKFTLHLKKNPFVSDSDLIQEDKFYYLMKATSIA
ncbi:EAL domain-containing protein [Lysinibacillus yapensis]|uniref:EAL domain-containing protein n=1 Tax=Ureibacillus yapensis TaxID=2304605 RepID=A0A396S8L4_9BACL|nr:EAL domain-containing protein [Lysinibacillus yapensis]RHW37432.1 EAL domain-containing protein [Lysinibacillus yapensis]